MSQNYTNPYKYWYLPLITGIIFIISGIYIFRTPLASYLTLSMIFAAIFFVTGIMEVVNAFSNRHYPNWGWSLAGGIVDLILGIMLISSPALSATILPLYVGITILFRSIMGIGSSLALKKVGIKSWGTVMIFSILGLLFAILMIVNPVFGGLTIVYYTAISFIMIGVFQIMLAFGLKKLK
ncbi:Uncharacterized membrane protein HdeD, DUF308 family [Soonwooa buanensis]|uniref:Uncharacterized membrane protein HdeD, DUF308 family n=1 Tax=Soonwooa buanensis TaxID=619805 RepID=A0A1T5F6M9_9FLAO|nr:DUF308 domain-containing protein [Soonwooa buanensis]SKB91819.1 Uncharacterized membrane protein HdeD, DUF308 family [Soonwooa buanensis]